MKLQCLAVVAAVMAALGGAGAAGAGASAPARVSGATPFAADCNGPVQTGNAYVNAEIEPYVAVNPRNRRNLVAVYQQDRYSNGGANGTLTSISVDAGRSWRVLPLRSQPRFARCSGGNAANGGDFERATDPWVSFGPDGAAYQAAVSFNDSNPRTAELVSKSVDGGRTWSPPATLIRDNDPNVSDERPAITADPTRATNVYAVWGRDVFAPAAAQRGPTYFSRTRNGGATWQQARPIYTPPVGTQTSGNQIAVLPNGDLIDVFKEFAVGANSQHPRHDPIGVIRSTDQGRTWSRPVQVALSSVVGLDDPRTGDTIRGGDVFADIAVDPRPGTNTVYVVWEDARFTANHRQQIALARSGDGGRTWSAPIRISANLHTQAFVPKVAVNDHGEVAVTYYDLSADTVRSRALATQYWITRSADGGHRWTARQQVTTRPFDLRTAPYSSGFFLGEYQGLAPTGDGFMVAATFANDRSLVNRTDIFAVPFASR